ncbi:serglycin [Discoglossus pictus]
MFPLFCLFLIAGGLVEGLPVQEATYKGVRCSPDDNSIHCIEEASIFEIAQESNKIPPLMKRSEQFWDMSPFSGEESGSGTDVTSEDETEVSFNDEPDVSSGEEPNVSSEDNPNVSSNEEKDVSSGDEFGSGNEYVVDYSDMTETHDADENYHQDLFEENLIL